MEYKKLKLYGDTFEREVERRLRFCLRSYKAKYITNKRVYSDKQKKYTEIDLIIITVIGVFIIEVKSFRTYLKGDIKARTWTGATGRYKTVLLNPLEQNSIHREALERAIKSKYNINNINILDIVCLRDSCEFNIKSKKIMNLTRLCSMLSTGHSICEHVYKVNELYNIIDSVMEVK